MRKLTCPCPTCSGEMILQGIPLTISSIRFRREMKRLFRQAHHVGGTHDLRSLLQKYGHEIYGTYPRM